MSYELKNGVTTEDPRLDRLVDFDERSRNYPIRELLDTTRPFRSYTWRCNAWLDQGREGACVGFSMAHELAARPAESQVHDSMARNIYHEAQHIDPWPGCSRGHDGGTYEGTSVLAGTKVAHKMGFFKEYRWAFGIDDVLLTLSYHGPVLLGIYWHNDMYTPDKDGYIFPTGRVVGGHAILARAYNDKEGRVTLRNSWGRAWGKDGDCYISVDDLDALLKRDGEAMVAIKRATTPKA